MARVRGDEQVEGRDGTPVGRRAVLGLIGLGAVGVVFGSGAESWLSKQVGRLSAKDPTGLTGLVPGGGGFRIYTVTAGYPSKSREEWRLKVDGLVDGPVVPHLRRPARPAADPDDQGLPVRHRLAGRGRRVGGREADRPARLRRCKPGAGYLHFTSFDGTYTESLTMEQARRPDVIVAHHMLGKPVTGSTVARCASTSRRCTATSRSSGSTASRSPTSSGPATGRPGLRRRRVGRAVERPRRRPGLMAAATDPAVRPRRARPALGERRAAPRPAVHRRSPCTGRRCPSSSGGGG